MTDIDPVANVALWYEIQQFLYFEARLQDERRFGEWVELFTEDALYWMPIQENRVGAGAESATTKYGDLAHFDDTKDVLRKRIDRLNTGMAWAETPPSQTTHLVSNLEILPPGGQHSSQIGVDGVALRSNFLVYRTHLEKDVDIFAGCRFDVVRKEADDWRIALRTVLLDGAVLRQKNMAIFF